ncbi:hypothetical protein HWV07_08485 [Natronomonas salina]|uniref:hypothetical protein n=1 Tax=Natronomonas salina TaxID=1710540 RepID=UPI0015B5F8A6|nr:hypothetical protein [Natronomonas salina]QLD89064.1 hypothetical protein HWV07_08485 [Natronomonas salina]
MESSNPESESGDFFDGPVETLSLGLAYVLVGIGLFYSVATDSTTLFRIVLVAILLLVVVSLYVLYRREGLLTAENGLIGGFVLLAMALLVVLSAFTALPFEVVFGVVFVVGVLVPGAILEYTEFGSAD